MRKDTSLSLKVLVIQLFIIHIAVFRNTTKNSRWINFTMNALQRSIYQVEGLSWETEWFNILPHHNKKKILQLQSAVALPSFRDSIKKSYCDSSLLPPPSQTIFVHTVNTAALAIVIFCCCVRVTVTTSCRLRFHDYPHDKQTCALNLESCE